ncbi:transposase [Thiohalocapsa marina]|uniref:transposase n=1 Tax=Thiohalocapsa marina TaxID=424902 RepID=UPI0036D98E7A
MPKRLRWYLEREPRDILLRVIEAHLRRGAGAGSQARFGAVSFIHRFGASLNRHVHYHCCVIDGVFEPVEEADDVPQSVRFRPAAELTPEALAAIAEQVRVRVLRRFARSGLIEPEDVREMLAWENSGFSLDAAVCVGGHDRAGLERLLRYCARLLHGRSMGRCCR